jgi:hypothetical protein
MERQIKLSLDGRLSVKNDLKLKNGTGTESD